MIDGVSFPFRSYCKSEGDAPGALKLKYQKHGVDMINAISHASVFPAMAR